MHGTVLSSSSAQTAPSLAVESTASAKPGGPHTIVLKQKNCSRHFVLYPRDDPRLSGFILENECDYATDDEQMGSDRAKLNREVFEAVEFFIQDDPTLLIANLLSQQ